MENFIIVQLIAKSLKTTVCTFQSEKERRRVSVSMCVSKCMVVCVFEWKGYVK
jgi:hypothetical protein